MNNVGILKVTSATKQSQNVLSEAQIKNFLSHRKVMLRSRDIQVFVFLTIP